MRMSLQRADWDAIQRFPVPDGVLLLAVLWRLRYKRSLRDAVELPGPCIPEGAPASPADRSPEQPPNVMPVHRGFAR